MNRIVFHFSFVVLFIFFSFFQIAKSADVPEILNYQGTLTDNTGQPITGTKEITFNLYDVASGGTASWSETQTVTLIDGKFSVVLGSTNPLNANPFYRRNVSGNPGGIRGGNGPQAENDKRGLCSEIFGRGQFAGFDSIRCHCHVARQCRCNTRRVGFVRRKQWDS